MVAIDATIVSLNGAARFQAKPKTKASRRTIVVTGHGIRGLLDALEETAGNPADSPLFPSARQLGWRTPNNIRRQLRTLLTENPHLPQGFQPHSRADHSRRQPPTSTRRSPTSGSATS
ncbi:hypothetical protein WJX64_02820 [Leifsonia sp. YIM 134122]|uniref:Transposase n=1 Tax=Leifsonia stereocauli TaxID=3134136 RepID=A0ABU9W0D7_9MICO